MAENNAGVINALKESQKEGAKVIKDELKDQFKPFTDQLMAPLNSIKAGISALPGVGLTKKLFSAVSTPLKNSFASDSKSNIEDQKAENAARREGEANRTLMESIRDGIFGIQKGLIEGLSGLKSKGLMGLGILAGLIAAPFAALVAFFTELGIQVKALDRFMKGGLSKLFRPIIRFFDAIGDIFGKAGTGKFLKGDTVKIFGKYADDIASFIGKIKKIFKPITDGIGKLTGFVKTSTTVMDGFRPVVKFAQGIGKVLGKIFLPITILMTLFDTVSGAVKGYEDGGWLGAIEGGITGLLTSIIGMPLDLLKSAVGFILGIFGFDNAKKSLDSFSFSQLITDFIGGIFDFGKKAFAWFGELFTDPVGALSSLWTGLVGEGGFIDLITKPFNMAVNWLLGLFGWSDPETEFNLLSFVKGMFDTAVNWVKGLFSWSSDPQSDFSLLGYVGEAFKGAVRWVKDLFSFGDEDASAAGITTKLIDILLAPYNLAVNFLMGLFGFSPEDFGQEGESFSIGKLVVDAIKGIYNWFKGLLDIDIGSIVDSIPGASTVLKALGIMEKSEEEKLAEKQQKIKDLQAQIDTGSLMSVGFSDKDEREELAQLQKELEDMKAQQTAGGGTVINNFNTDNRKSEQNVTLSNQQLQDANGIANS